MYFLLIFFKYPFIIPADKNLPGEDIQKITQRLYFFRSEDMFSDVHLSELQKYRKKDGGEQEKPGYKLSQLLI